MSKRFFHTILILGWLISAAACKTTQAPSELSSEGRAIGSLRGIDAINQSLGRYLPWNGYDLLASHGAGIMPLGNILGRMRESGTVFKRNGNDPNPLNMMLWHQLMKRQAEDLAQRQCSDAAPSSEGNGNSFPQNNFSSASEADDQPFPRSVCTHSGPLTEEQKSGMLLDFHHLVGWDSSSEGLAILEDINKLSTDGTLEGYRLVEAFYYIALMSPDFLLSK